MTRADRNVRPPLSEREVSPAVAGCSKHQRADRNVRPPLSEREVCPAVVGCSKHQRADRNVRPPLSEREVCPAVVGCSKYQRADRNVRPPLSERKVSPRWLDVRSIKGRTGMSALRWQAADYGRASHYAIYTSYSYIATDLRSRNCYRRSVISPSSSVSFRDCFSARCCGRNTGSSTPTASWCR
jgi:hypothetical protein